MICSPDAQDCEASGRQTEVNQLDERIATLQLNEQAQYATISSLETSLDNRHAHLSNLEARIAELEASGDPDLASLREMSQKQLEIASTLRQLISDNQGQAQARAKIIESQRQQLTARHRRNVLKQAEGDEVAAKLLATRRETMRLRNKIKELKQQHAELRQMKNAQQQQLLVSADTPEGQNAQSDSGLNLRFDHLSRVTKYVKDTRTRVFALDMSMNRIETDWTSLTPVLDTLLAEQLVQYLDLGMNCLPPLSSLKELPAEKQTFRKFGWQLSLGLDCVSYSGDPDLDYWIKNARTFKLVAYGLTEFVDDAAEL
ncbi:MAG: hypothetical protein FRX49_02690 [Trebouxia sp. A1-2]|nr:MAG: hypothetical protein FRX49_02690 [Trebouxia sp. A1-2]